MLPLPSSCNFIIKTTHSQIFSQMPITVTIKQGGKMSKNLQKSLQDYLSKLKLPTQLQIHTKPITSSTKNWILSGCRHPKTTSFALDHHHQSHGRDDDAAATLSDIDRFLFENFGSLYCDKKKNDDHEETPNGFLFESPKLVDPPPDIRASHRFFVSHSTSNSLVEDARSSSSSNTTFNESIRESTEVKGLSLPDESIAVLTYSPDPYDDFRQSMQEMVEARLQQNQSIDWDYMEELLFCYLKLNERKSYKYILGAFADMIVKLRQNTERNPANSRRAPTTRTRERRGRKGDVT